MSRYFVQGEQVRGEPRIYWVEDRQKRYGRNFEQATGHTTSERTAERWCDKLNAEHEAALALTSPESKP
jgi:hypothetical protein